MAKCGECRFFNINENSNPKYRCDVNNATISPINTACSDFADNSGSNEKYCKNCRFYSLIREYSKLTSTLVERKCKLNNSDHSPSGSCSEFVPFKAVLKNELPTKNEKTEIKELKNNISNLENNQQLNNENKKNHRSDTDTSWICFHCGNLGYGYSDKTLFYKNRFHPECYDDFKNTDSGKKWIIEKENEKVEEDKIRNINLRRDKISGIIFPIISCVILFFIIYRNNQHSGFITLGVLLIIHFIISRFLILFLQPFSAQSTKLGIILKLLFTIIVWSIYIGISFYLSNLIINVFSSTPNIDMGSSIKGVE